MSRLAESNRLYRSRDLIFGIAILLATPESIDAATIVVDDPSQSIQVAIDSAADGDTVLVGPGVYNESLTIESKSITLASQFLMTGDPTFIDQTVISGAGLGAGGTRAPWVIVIRPTAGSETRIIGLTLQDASDGILPFAPAEYSNLRITNTNDGIDFESGSGGLIRDSVLELNSDDGLDLDGAVDVTIERNQIRNNGDDGIEIRLHDLPGYTGPTLQIVIRDNTIRGNGEDGIQLIDDTTLTPRVFTIERNIIADNGFAGVGMMCCQNSLEDFQGASIPERVLLVNNTFSGNDHGVTGGDNLVALNNLFVNSTNIGLKNADANSIAAYNLFFENGIDHQGSNVDLATTLLTSPLLDPMFELSAGSPAIDAGTAFFQVGAEVVLDLSPEAYAGANPDLGARESWATDVPLLSWPIQIALSVLLLLCGRRALSNNFGENFVNR
jgi:hypothetical protein